MGAFSVAFTALAVSTMTNMVVAPAGVADSMAPALPDQGLQADTDPTFLSGFRMEGSPEIELVFGDTDRYKQHVDRFFALAKSMDKARQSFGGHIQASLAAVAAGKGCPTDAVSGHYALAFHDGESYRQLGAELEREEAQIAGLDELGESAALTPDYRWRVQRVRTMYQGALTDLREMRVAFIEQLQPELVHRGCPLGKLLVAGDAEVAAGTVPAAPDGVVVAVKPTGKPAETPLVPASTATFVVDNRACLEGLAVYVDSSLLGTVPGRSKVAFQALAGNHSLCLIGSTTAGECGDPGTMRNAYIHDGWTVTLHCAAK